ncbi:MAG: ABC transporter ATP-binding protein [Thermodesulfobacteriota bacterium]|nr:ABC transporter ATP-binding protein [Thermodesulfobacteriota bacterium]
MLDVLSISVFYDGIQALWGVSFSVQEKAVTALVGSNGAGKTTTLSTVAGLLKPKEGSISFEGSGIDALESHERVEQGISLVPEGRRLFPFLTVQENLEVGAYSKRARPQLSESMKRIYDLFPRLHERKGQLAGTLSGGEQQMLAIGRGLMSRPRLLILDEPSLGLSPLFVLKMFELIQQVNRQGVTILLVEQNVQTTLQIAQRAYVLETGKIVLEGTGARLLEDDHIQKAYLGL